MPDDTSTRDPTIDTCAAIADPMSLLDLSHVIVRDPEDRIVFWSQADEEIYGWSKAEAIGRRGDELLRTESPAMLATVRALVAQGKRWEGELVHHHHDGRAVIVTTTWAPLRDATGARVGTFEVNCDITDRRQAELTARLSEHKFLERAVLEAGERESRRIGQELHDHLCQYLLGAAFATKALATTLERDSPQSVHKLGAIATLINESVLKTRDIARGLKPVELDAAGLMTALHELVARIDKKIRSRIECDEPVLLADNATARHAYRIAQEAVANAQKHSGASEIIIRLREEGGHVRLEIADNGKGISERQPTGLGIPIMRYRTHAIGGTLTIESSDRGTSIICSFARQP